MWRQFLIGMQYPLNVELHQHKDHFLLTLACKSHAFQRSQLVEFAEEFTKRFIEICHTPETHLRVIRNLPQHDEDAVTASSKHRSSTNGSLHHPKFLDLVDVLSTCTNVPVSAIRADSSLISMGIDSIISIQLASKLRNAGLNIKASEIIQCEMVSDLLDKQEGLSAPHINGHSHLNGRAFGKDNYEYQSYADKLQADVSTVEAVRPASAGMKWLIAMWQLSERSRFQHTFAYKLPLDVEVDRLRLAFFAIAQRHPILRSTFVSLDGKEVQIVTLKEMENIWSTSHISGEESNDDLVARTMKDMVSNTLPTNRPPARAVLLYCNDVPHLILHLHHFQYDAWSLIQLMDDLTGQYLNGNGRPRTLANSDALGDFLSHCQENARLEQRTYWKKHLGQKFVPALLKGSRFIPAQDSRKVVIEQKVVSDVASLLTVARQRDVSLSSVIIACWARTQMEFSMGSSSTFGVWHSGRSADLAGVDKIAVPTMNVLPFHVNFDLDASLLDSCRYVHSELRLQKGAVEQSYIEDIAEWSNIKDQALFNVCLNILDSRMDHEGGDGDGFVPMAVCTLHPSSRYIFR